jgi:hypothetical protein
MKPRTLKLRKLKFRLIGLTHLQIKKTKVLACKVIRKKEKDKKRSVHQAWGCFAQLDTRIRLSKVQLTKVNSKEINSKKLKTR